MKNFKLYTILTAIAFTLSVQFSQAQYNYMIRGAEHILLETDSVQLPSPQNFRGTLVWQKSPDYTTWTNVMNSNSVDTLGLKTGTPAMYRLALGEGTCDTLFSDTVLVGKTDNANDLVNAGFTISELIDADIPLNNLIADNVPVVDLIDAGFSIDTLYEGGVTVEQFADAQVSLDDLLASDIPLIDIYEGGFLVGTLEQHGVDSIDLVNAGLIGVVKDYDGNSYKWVKIGDQIWMAENLKVTHWQGGTPIQTTADPNEDIEWWDPADSRLQWAYNGNENNVDIYGRLYTYYTIEGDSICPSGWHVPDSLEFDALAQFLGGYDVAGGKMKSTSTLWNAPNEGATNECGFDGLPAASRSRTGSYGSLGVGAAFWTLNSINSLYYDHKRNDVHTISYKQSGFSVRCIKD